MTANNDLYRAARDQLVELITDYERAVAEFDWPRLTGAFNWATDWFDVIARGNARPALWIVEQDGTERKVTFAEMADPSTVPLSGDRVPPLATLTRFTDHD